MWKDEHVIAVCDSAVLRLDASGRIESEILKEGFTCTTNAVAAAGNVLCVATSDKAKIAIISESQSFKASVPEVMTALAFSRNGEVLYAGSSSGRLYVWQLKTGTLVQSKSVFFNAITDVKVDFANTTILIAAQNGDICLFNLVELFWGDAKSTLYLGHSTSITGLVNLMQGPLEQVVSFVSVSRDKNIRFWHHTKRISTQSHFLQHTPLSMVPSHTGARLYVPCEMGHIAVVPICNFNDTFLLSGHIGSVTGCAETNKLVTCALDGIRIWDVESKLCLSHYSGLGPRVNRIINNVRLADDIKFVPLKNVVSKDAQATICLR
ncbi:hypothetical protein X943_001523 [Babesia divergens]|uniref:Uncharacterized protein n=1 Tax=Babesia divergens TaxID=32595 RepID=A0AAD9G6X8_BABDI|nr:hypothetical protein X943_001523 [Babesia divergens]